MKKLLLQSLAAVLLSILSFVALASDDEIFDDRFYVAPMASVSGTRGGVADSNGIGGSLAVGKSVMPHLGIELIGDYLHYKGKTVTTPGSGVLCGILPCSSTVTQYPSKRLLVGGAGVNLYFSQFNSGLFIHGDVEGGDHFAFNGGVGFDQPFFSRAVYLRLELLAHKEPGYDTKPLGHLGIRIPFGSQHHADATAPDQPVQVVPVDETPAPDSAAAPEASPVPPEGTSTDAAQSSPAAASDEQSAPVEPAGDIAPQAASDAAPAAEAAPVVEPAAEPAAPPPAKKHVAKRHKKAKPAKAATPIEPSNTAPEQAQPDATSRAPEPTSEAPASESAPASEPVAAPAAASSAPSDDWAVPTEPAPAPPASKQ